jgi:hypothetical protein
MIFNNKIRKLILKKDKMKRVSHNKMLYLSRSISQTTPLLLFHQIKKWTIIKFRNKYQNLAKLIIKMEIKEVKILLSPHHLAIKLNPNTI